MLIEVKGLTKIFHSGKGRFNGLHRVNFQVERGEMIAIVGHNGAGKSTLLKLLANWILPDDGKMLLEGVSLANRKVLASQIGFVPEVCNLFEQFSIEHNFKLFAALCKMPDSRIEEVLDQLNLKNFRRHKVRILSKGLKQRASIARSLIPHPTILLCDEPTSGLDREMTQEIYQLLRKMHANGKTILFTSHRPEEIKPFITRVLVLQDGRITFDGAASEYYKSETRSSLSVCL